MSYNVHTVEYLGAPNHVAIFIETEDNGSSKQYHVVGTILVGMEHEIKTVQRPEMNEGFVPGTQNRLGRIQKADIARFEAVCRDVAPPDAQVKLNGQRWILLSPSVAVANGYMKLQTGPCLRASSPSENVCKSNKAL